MARAGEKRPSEGGVEIISRWWQIWMVSRCDKRGPFGSAASDDVHTFAGIKKKRKRKVTNTGGFGKLLPERRVQGSDWPTCSLLRPPISTYCVCTAKRPWRTLQSN